MKAQYLIVETAESVRRTREPPTRNCLLQVLSTANTLKSPATSELNRSSSMYNGNARAFAFFPLAFSFVSALFARRRRQTE